MRKSNLLRISTCLIMLGACVSGLGVVRRQESLTLLVVPVRYSVLQVMFDVAARYPAVLVSYQGGPASEEPLLHAWNGAEWVFVSREDYRTARFLADRPSRTVLIGEEKDLPRVLIGDSEWCPMVMSIPAVDTATLLNSLDKVFDFRQRDWEWFAARYNLAIEDMNEELRQQSWYDRPFVERLPAREERIEPEPVYAYPEEEPAPELQPEPQPMPEETVEPEAPGGAAWVPAEPETPAPAVQPAAPLPAAPEGWQERAVATDVK